MCNYIIQNITILIFIFLFFIFSMRKKSFITFNYDKTKKNIYNGINNWNDTQGWILIIFVPIFVIISIIEKWAPITIILNTLGIYFCK